MDQSSFSGRSNIKPECKKRTAVETNHYTTTDKMFLKAATFLQIYDDHLRFIVTVLTTTTFQTAFLKFCGELVSQLCDLIGDIVIRSSG